MIPVGGAVVGVAVRRRWSGDALVGWRGDEAVVGSDGGDRGVAAAGGFGTSSESTYSERVSVVLMSSDTSISAGGVSGLSEASGTVESQPSPVDGPSSGVRGGVAGGLAEGGDGGSPPSLLVGGDS